MFKSIVTGLALSANYALAATPAGPSKACAKADFGKLWHGRGAYEAGYENGQPSIALPLIGAGFNRTLDIDGFCNNVLYDASQFTCHEDAGGELRTLPKKTSGAGVFARFGDSNCPLSGITFRKTPGGHHEANIRFEFDGCKNKDGTAAPVGSTVVELGLRKVQVMGINALKWVKEVCGKAPTTPAPVQQVQVQSRTTTKLVAKGKCSSGTQFSASTQVNSALCESKCQYETTEAKAKGNPVCTGFSYSTTAAGDNCFLYNKEEPTTTDKNDAFNCYSMAAKKAGSQSMQQATAAASPLTVFEQHLRLREAFAGVVESMNVAKLVELKPEPECDNMASGSKCWSDKSCFTGMWWFQLQDDSGVAASLPVIETEWDELMKLIPTAVPVTEKLTFTRAVMDRVLVKTCKGEQKWDRSCVMPAAPQVCPQPGLVNAIITGVGVPVLGWLAVFVFAGARKLLPSNGAEGQPPTCNVLSCILCCLIAIVACCLVSFALSTLITYILGSETCLHGLREMQAIDWAAAVPAWVAMCAGIIYVWNISEKAANKQPGPSQQHAAPAGQASGHRLMLVEVTEDPFASGGQVRAKPINPDILRTGNSAMASMNSAQGGDNSIWVSGTNMQSFMSSGNGNMVSYMATDPNGSSQVR